jgi:hypothetical protein
MRLRRELRLVVDAQLLHQIRSIDPFEQLINFYELAFIRVPLHKLYNFKCSESRKHGQRSDILFLCEYRYSDVALVIVALKCEEMNYDCIYLSVMICSRDKPYS